MTSLRLPDKLDICITHSPCSDGFSAAWSVYKRYGKEVEYLPGNHEKGKSDLNYWIDKCKNKHVLVADFNFSRYMTEILHEVSASYISLDHHITAKEALIGLDYCYFDMARSGALITWETLHPKALVPLLIKYVSDRDIWKNELLSTQAINTVIHRTERTFENWDSLAARLEASPVSYNSIVDQGDSMLKYQDGLVRDVVAKASIWKIAGIKFLAANCPCIATEVCDVLRNSHEGPVATFEIQDNIVKFSLRSLGEYSVADIAKKFSGGGGHRNAAGFSVMVGKVNWESKRVDP